MPGQSSGPSGAVTSTAASMQPNDYAPPGDGGAIDDACHAGDHRIGPYTTGHLLHLVAIVHVASTYYMVATMVPHSAS
jgi:hypothetical protein